MASQTFAEYQHSAPELAPQIQAADSSAAKEGARPLYGESALVEKAHHQKRLLGLAPRTLIILIVIAVLVIVGVVVGVVVGTKHKSTNSTDTPSSSRSSSLSSSSSPTGTATPTVTPLAIIQAIWGGQDITDKARSSMEQNGDLVLNMSSTAPWGNPDPWVGIQKCVDILHSSGSSIRTFVACESDGPFTLPPGNFTPSAHVHEITRQGPTSSNFAIVSVVWGAAEIRDGAVYQTLYDYKMNKTEVPFDNNVFGTDTLPTVSKSGVIWYTEDNFSTYKSIYAREGTTVTF